MKLQPSSDYVDKVQSKITSHMRAVLIDWLIEVSDEFKLVTETLYLAIAYIDRFLSTHPINNSDFQLLGVTCMCIAAKYEEIHPPHMERFSYITDHVCSVEDIADAEAEVLQGLDFRLASPTPKVRHSVQIRFPHFADLPSPFALCPTWTCRHTLHSAISRTLHLILQFPLPSRSHA